MEIKVHSSNPSFGGLKILSKDAEKILKKADRIVKSSNATFLDVNIPEGHKKPLWSVLSEHLSKRQTNNKNNILIDIFDKSKQLLSVVVTDIKGFVHKKWTINPMPVIGKYNEVIPPADNLSYTAYYHSLDPKTYGKSKFFDVIDSAEAEADVLNQKLTESMRKAKKNEYPRIKKSKKSGVQSKKAERSALKKQREAALKKASVPHVQRPFEGMKEILSRTISESQSTKTSTKTQNKTRNRLPRKLKKELKTGKF